MKRKIENGSQLLLYITITLLPMFVHSQSYNTNSSASHINVNIQKTPESASFERYGNFNTNDINGTLNLSIPLYELKTKDLSVPLTLSYNPSGIKVSQEATWVGLGFDLNVGGRITAEVRGAPDNFTPSYGTTEFRSGWTRLLTRCSGVMSLARQVYGVANTADAAANQYTDPSFDDCMALGDMAWYGMGEPDIYHANFMGHGFSFYFDKLTDSLAFLGEKNLFAISFTKDSYGKFTAWYVTDNNGIKYYFEQQEISRISTQSSSAYSLYPYTVGDAGAAWLLTKVIHPSGDSVVFRYANYGVTYPAFEWQSSVSYKTGQSGTSLSIPSYNYNEQPQAEILPAYLTQIESNNALINFYLSTRTDINGAGARKLDSITVVEKYKSIVRKGIYFNYDYFTSNVNDLNTPLSTSITGTAYAQKRLKLNSLYMYDTILAAPYKFYYYSGNTGSIPQKFSVAKDYWGYYNGNTQNTSFIPAISSMITDGILDATLDNFAGAMGVNGFDGGGSRSSVPICMPVMTLDSIQYPTGGTSKFIFEPHTFMYKNKSLTGGGLRIKTIKNYASAGVLAGQTEYRYGNGVYLGSLNFFSNDYRGDWVLAENDINSTPVKVSTISSVAGSNNYDFTVAYDSVKSYQYDAVNNRNNGFVIKVFNIPSPSDLDISSISNTYIQPATYPTSGNNYAALRTIALTQATPMLRGPLDLKQTYELYCDSAGNILKKVQYTYDTLSYTNKVFSIRVQDHFSAQTHSFYGSSYAGYVIQGYGNGYHRFTFWLMSGQSYHVVADSIITYIYSGGNSLKTFKKYIYNKYMQPEIEVSDNSQGSSDINVTKTTLSYDLAADSANLSGDALTIRNLQKGHIYELPVEQISMKKSLSGDTLVLQSNYNRYVGILLSKVFLLNKDSVLKLNNTFYPAYYSTPGHALIYSNNYYVNDTAGYNISGLIVNRFNKSSPNMSYIWNNSSEVVAVTTNSAQKDIAFCSFEDAESSGNWTIPSAVRDNTTAITGKNSYLLTNGNISKTGLSSNVIYIVSYWSSTGSSYSVSGSTSVKQGKTINGWTYFEHTVSNVTSITVSGTGKVDELRLYPSTAQMTTYTYEPLLGISSQCDINNRITYYEYDPLSRLYIIRDQDRNVVKKYCYNYAGHSTACRQFYNVVKSGTFTRNNCGSGYSGSAVTYTVPANKYISWISQAAADSLAQNDVNLNGQNYANTNGTCTSTGYTITSTNYVGLTGFTATFTNTSTSVQTVFNIPAAGGALGSLPGGTYNIVMAKTGNTSTPYTYKVCSTTKAAAVTVTFSSMVIGSSCNTVLVDGQ